MPEFGGTLMNFYQLILVTKMQNDGLELTPARYEDAELALSTWQEEARKSREFRLSVILADAPGVPDIEKIPQRLYTLRAMGQLWKVVDRYNEMIPKYNQLDEIEEEVFNKFWEDLGRLDLP